MSERITHTAILDDTLRLLLRLDTVDERVRRAVAENWELARLGSATRYGDRFNPGLLARIRDEWERAEDKQPLLVRLAFVVGWLCHRAADREMKPVFRAAGPKVNKPTDCSVYHEAFVYRTVYRGRDESVFDDTVAGVEPIPGADEQVRSLFHSLLQQSLIELHTFSPDTEDPWSWIGNMAEARAGFYVEIDRYAKAITNPDPDKYHHFITEMNFYNEADPLVKLARAIQDGAAPGSDEVAAAADANHTSHYGVALQTAFTYVRGANGFLQGNLTPEQLRAALNIGEMGVDGKPV